MVWGRIPSRMEKPDQIEFAGSATFSGFSFGLEEIIRLHWYTYACWIIRELGGCQTKI